MAISPLSSLHPRQGDTRVFLYELLPEAPFFLECNSFTSPDPHKVNKPLHSWSSFPRWDHRVPLPSRGHVGKYRGPWGQWVTGQGVPSSASELIVKLNHY